MAEKPPISYKLEVTEYIKCAEDSCKSGIITEYHWEDEYGSYHPYEPVKQYPCWRCKGTTWEPKKDYLEVKIRYVNLDNERNVSQVFKPINRYKIQKQVEIDKLQSQIDKIKVEMEKINDS